MVKRMMMVTFGYGLALLVCSLLLTGSARAQLLRQGDYGVGVTITLYQYDDLHSKLFPLVSTLKSTSSTPEDEAEYIMRTFKAEEVKVRYTRSVGLREGEIFTDSQPINDRQLSFTITPRIVTKGDLTIDFVATYGDKTLLEAKSITVNSYETVLLRGGQGAFAAKEFKTPQGTEKAPESRALLVTITPVVQNTRALQNKPSDISRPTDQYGSKITIDSSDIFVMPTLVGRAPLLFPPGSKVRGSITLEGIVTPDGRITNIRVLDSPDPALNPKAIEAFRLYRFNPAKLNGRPTFATFRETILLSKPDNL